MPNQKGTGKHPHKDTEEPFPHTKGSKQEGQSSGAGTAKARSKPQHEESESGDLKEREYRDSKGEIHHHTRTSSAEKNKK